MSAPNDDDGRRTRDAAERELLRIVAQRHYDDGYAAGRRAAMQHYGPRVRLAVVIGAALGALPAVLYALLVVTGVLRERC